MRISVVVCTHTTDRYEDLTEAVESLFAQTYDDVEVVLVADGDAELCERLRTDYGDRPEVRIHCHEQNRGLSASRNAGIEVATGDVVAFMDDDAVADPGWLAELVKAYEEHDVEAVGGKMTARWMDGQPNFLPGEFYWLVGVTHRGFPDEGPVRNTFGSNLSFRADVLDALGGFNENLGRRGDRQGQGEEAELARRLRSELGGTLYYIPDATVEHKVYSYRTRLGWLLGRAFWQGYSKQRTDDAGSGAAGAERSYLTRLLREHVPRRVRDLVHNPSWAAASQLAAIGLFTAAVGAGYAYASIRAVTRIVT